MANKHQVIAAFKADPNQTSGDIAKKLVCSPAYVRATLSRNGLKLKRGPTPRKYRAEAEALIRRAQMLEHKAEELELKLQMRGNPND